MKWYFVAAAVLVAAVSRSRGSSIVVAEEFLPCVGGRVVVDCQNSFLLCSILVGGGIAGRRGGCFCPITIHHSALFFTVPVPQDSLPMKMKAP